MHGYSLFVSLIVASVVISSLTTVGLLVALIVIRTRNAVVRRQRDAVTQGWRNVFKTAYTGEPEPDPLPAVGKRDWFTVLALFVQFHEAREKDRPRVHEVYPILDDMAIRVGIDEYALKLLGKGDDADKILALNVLGHLRDPRAYDSAVALVEEEGPELSRAAAQCAVRIDPRFLPRLLELVGKRDDWVRSRVEAMLREIATERLNKAMAKAIEESDDASKIRLLDYLRFCEPGPARVICKNVLDAAEDPETIAAALRSLAPLAGDNDHGLALNYCRHKSPIVLLSALRVLRKCVRPDDRELLMHLAAHRDYWVRLRAAEAIVQLYGNSGLLQQTMQEHPDRYARDAIKQAMAERKMFAMRKPAQDRRGAFAAKEG